MIDLSIVGAHLRRTDATNWEINFGIYLPGITPSKGYSLKVCVIHEDDQFVRSVPPQEFALNWMSGSETGLSLRRAVIRWRCSSCREA